MNKKKMILIVLLLLIGAIVVYFALSSKNIPEETPEEKAVREQKQKEDKISNDIKNEAFILKMKRVAELEAMIPQKCNIPQNRLIVIGSNECKPYENLIRELHNLLS